MKRAVRLLALCLAAAAPACDAEPEVVVVARVDGRPAAGVPIRLLPYDRAAILDSLAAAAGEPEPRVPPELVQALRNLEAGASPVKLAADSLVSAAVVADRIRAQADSLRAARRAWAERAYAPFEEIARRRRETAEREELADTTDPSGRATFRVPPGRWWVSAAYRLPFSELRWSVPVRIAGDSTVVVLDAASAITQPAL